MAKLLVVQLAIENAVVAAVYFMNRDYARVAYWAASSVLITTTLFMGR